MTEYLCCINLGNEIRPPENFTGFYGPDYYIGIRGECKFGKDSIFEENTDFLILLIGVIFNKNRIILENKGKSWFDTITGQYNQLGETFFTRLKGSFNGILLDKHKNKWIFFSNIQSERPVFYSLVDGGFLFASSIGLIHSTLSNYNRKLTLNLDGAYMLLSYGYMLHGYTLYNEVKRIKSGYYSTCINGSLAEVEYYRFDNQNCVSDNQLEIINKLDFLFDEAVRLQFEKDVEYGFDHIATLSGGLDSRMTVFCAHKLGYARQLNVTFSQSNTLDQEIACQIASSLKHQWIFKALDNGSFLYALDDITRLTGGNVNYSSVAHSHSLWSVLNFENFGILHTGQLGSLYPDQPDKKPQRTDGAYTEKLVDKISTSAIDIEKYENTELFLIHNRYLYGTNYGLAAILPFTETFSPHYDLAFWEYCLTIPFKLRNNHNIYKQWIMKKHPSAAAFKWERTGLKVNSHSLRNSLLLYSGVANMSFADLFTASLRNAARLFNLKYSPSLKGMNPYNAWLIINYELKTFLTGYFNANIHLTENFPELRKDCEMQFSTGSPIAKMQVLSLLSAIKIYC